MLSLTRARAIYVHPGKTDRRYGLRGLTAMAGQPGEGELHVFCSADRKQVKMVLADEGCIYLLQKRLTAGRYPWSDGETISAVDALQLTILLEGATLSEKISQGGKIRQMMP